MGIWPSDAALVEPLVIALGAVLGALSRYYLVGLISRWWGAHFPYGTLAVNLSGTLLMGFFTALGVAQVTSPGLQTLLTTGFVGSYTTFSTYALNTSSLARSHSRTVAFLYWAGSAIGGGLCLAAGLAVGLAAGQWLT